MADQSEAYKLLRSFLRKSVRGPNTDALLNALALNAEDLIHNARAVNDNLFIISAEGRYLQQRLADRGLNYPVTVGLSDEDFRKLGIEVTTRKQVRDLINQILESIYGYEYSRAYMAATAIGPYNLDDGDLLRLQFDDAAIVSIEFLASQFQNINAATAQEVADVITRGLRRKGRAGFATTQDDGSGAYVVLVSPTIGSASSVKVLGGKAQNQLKFPFLKPTSQDATTQVTLTTVPGGIVRATWTGGTAPGFGKAALGDYVNVYGTGFSPDNRGTFQVAGSRGGSLGDSYIEWINPIGVSETASLGSPESLLIFSPKRATLTSKPNFTAAYQVEDKVLEVYLPAITRVVRRERVDASYIFDTPIPANATETVGNFLYDPTKPYAIASSATTTLSPVDSSSDGFIRVVNSAQFPDAAGQLVFGFGTDKEEGPIPYIGRPSTGLLRVSPTYRFKKSHASGTDIALIGLNSPVQVDSSGKDLAFYLTDISGGRLYAEELLNTVTATGIKLVITILYPDDTGLGKWGTENSEKAKVFGE